YTPAMFGPDGEALPNARAFEYVEETVRGWYPAEQVDVQSFSADTRDDEPLRGKNLILTLPGQLRPDEVVILSAHLDSTAREAPEQYAPGAEDNASGSATLLEVARLLQGQSFERTLRIIWFTGEEQGLLGSAAYVAGLADPGAVVGVVNLDMFGYDSDGDRCFEIHAGTLPESQQVAECFARSAAEYGQELERFDLLTERAIGGSDHGSFWKAGIGAVEILEDMFENNLPEGCPSRDPNPNYHTENDTADQINPDSAIRIARTALAAVMAMAVPAAAPAAEPASTTGAVRMAQPRLLQPLPLPVNAVCGVTSTVDGLLGAVTLDSWSGWVRRLSGADPVVVGGQTTTILSRYSRYLFNGTSPAYDYVLEQVAAWYPQAWIEEDPFQYTVTGEEWKNLVLTIPGSVTPETVVMLTAHLDSTAGGIPVAHAAPGADDNATGAAVLLEAARVLRSSAQDGGPFPNTLRLVWFTGEEQGLVGSRAYANDHDLAGVTGVVNVDMIGFDSDNDRCFELHVGDLPQSDRVGRCLVESIAAYDLDLTLDYLTTGATGRSDHASFWDHEVGAVEVLENLFYHALPGGCSNADGNPHYHSDTDTIAYINLTTS
ncbi:MAG: Zn-dependent exopeptidase M28, partial [Chloroflexi bacterium]